MKVVSVHADRNDKRTVRFGIPKMMRTITVLLSLLLILSIWTERPSLGAVPKLDTVRVGIFLEVPGKYKLNTTSTTFSSAAAIQVGLRQPAGVSPIFQTKAAETIRFTLDDYKPIVVENANFQTALAVLKRLKALGGTGILTSLYQSSGLVYQVIEGAYATAAEARTAADRWSKDSAIAGLIGGNSKLDLKGPLHLEAGTFTSKADAIIGAQSFGAVGVDAFPALKQTGAAASTYTVLVGAATDAASLENVKALATKGANGISLRPLDASSVYMALRDDYTIAESAQNPLTLYTVPMSGAKISLSTTASTGIKLVERYNRSYRGQFEVSGFNNKLAIINELPFEQYLYAVVGAEMPSSWSAEALKAQAVAARTYAIYQGFGFQIAHVVDTTLSQAYGGIGSEKPSTIAAVDATSGEVAMYNGKVIESVFSSSAGGATADAKEIWGSDVAYLKTVSSPDESSEKGLNRWYRVVLPNGDVGYVREDLVEDSGQKTAIGQALLRIKGDGVKVRPIPLVQDDVPAVGQANKGTLVVMLEKVSQSNEMSWIRGPYTPEALLALTAGKLNKPISGPIRTLEASQIGPSGRPTELLANGVKLAVKTPDSFRAAFGGLPSTRFDIDETARMTIAGTDGLVQERPASSSVLVVVGGDGQAKELAGNNIFIMNGEGKLRAATKNPTFRFVGNGNGHGVGLSQYGARGLAELGYDYKYILQYYYKDIKIVKD
ncbi:hypothetical protein Back11_06240 [Paenibacillus baekrokdamisoli]|uniref:Sporulation stage II protein D amidase enhancer LytB N-terminal domain-containing protein n=1 Tax=Paenibacillus baekrokdamisoli TaxID=1712516 RepID=A0A3G9J8A6_9BACL|nr:SpoIID/LytB domain-containing protein [Paenibacillus baekrokdamisoli]MBB3067536.1 stage II sporulation protein D [Paenibacillus baekrokdamisoli]BBH19279.1 hypothetical protein Back11_06240 [Paenibacillus baekrokdamisoli]